MQNLCVYVVISMLKAVWVLVLQNVFALLCCCSLFVDGEVCGASGGRGEGVGSETLGADLIGSCLDRMVYESLYFLLNVLFSVFLCAGYCSVCSIRSGLLAAG